MALSALSTKPIEPSSSAIAATPKLAVSFSSGLPGTDTWSSISLRQRSAQGVACGRAGMRVVAPVQHQHRAPDRREGGREDPLRLEAKHVGPALPVALRIDARLRFVGIRCASVGVERVGQAVVHVLRSCQSILFVTGVGISADSGMPTYRGIGGLYEIEATEEGLPIEKILSGPMLHSNPELTWKYLGQIADATRGASFNRAHEVIAQMEKHFSRVWTLTQNVDGFHRLAGSRNVIEIHGNLRSLSCMQCDARQVIDEDEHVKLPPRCLVCSAIMRPDVVLFEELLPQDSVRQLRCELETGFDAVFSIGTSAVFPYIQQPVIAARQTGVPTIEINPSQTLVSRHADYRLVMGAATAMDEIWSRFSRAVS